MRAEMKKIEKLVNVYENGLKEIKHRDPLSYFTPINFDEEDYYDD
jgi:hypothetical protein